VPPPPGPGRYDRIDAHHRSPQRCRLERRGPESAHRRGARAARHLSFLGAPLAVKGPWELRRCCRAVGNESNTFARVAISILLLKTSQAVPEAFRPGREWPPVVPGRRPRVRVGCLLVRPEMRPSEAQSEKGHARHRLRLGVWTVATGRARRAVA